MTDHPSEVPDGRGTPARLQATPVGLDVRVTDFDTTGLARLGRIRLLDKEDSFEPLPALIDEVMSCR